MAWLVDVFVDQCREKFQFLVDEFGCQLASAEKYRAGLGDGRVAYQNGTTAVRVAYEGRDRAVWTVLMRLVNGKPPAYGDPDNCHGLWTVVRLRAPARRRELAGRVLTEADMEAAVGAEASLVRDLCMDILRGDFSIFPELKRVEAEGWPPEATGGGGEQASPPG